IESGTRPAAEKDGTETLGPADVEGSQRGSRVDAAELIAVPANRPVRVEARDHSIRARGEEIRAVCGEVTEGGRSENCCVCEGSAAAIDDRLVRSRPGDDDLL